MRTKGAAETLAIVDRLDRLVKAVGRSVEYMITMLDAEHDRAAEEMKERCVEYISGFAEVPDFILDGIRNLPTRVQK